MKKGKNTKSSAQWARPLICMSAVKGLMHLVKGTIRDPDTVSGTPICRNKFICRMYQDSYCTPRSVADIVKRPERVPNRY